MSHKYVIKGFFTEKFTQLAKQNQVKKTKRHQPTQPTDDEHEFVYRQAADSYPLPRNNEPTDQVEDNNHLHDYFDDGAGDHWDGDMGNDVAQPNIDENENETQPMELDGNANHLLTSMEEEEELARRVEKILDETDMQNKSFINLLKSHIDKFKQGAEMYARLVNDQIDMIDD